MYKEFLKRKEKVIISAIELLDEGGIQGLTTKELAKREGVSEPAIYKQFDSKQDIIIAILDRFASYDDVIMNTIIEQKMPPRESVFYYAEAYAGYYQSYPQITTVMFSFDVYRYDKETDLKMKNILNKRYGFMTDIIKRGQEQKQFDNSIHPMEYAEILLGIIWSITFKWKTENCVGDLKWRITSALKWALR